MTPLYRTPPGYSETYRQQLEINTPTKGIAPGVQPPASSLHGPQFFPESRPMKSMKKPDPAGSQPAIGTTTRGDDRSLNALTQDVGETKKKSNK